MRKQINLGTPQVSLDDIYQDALIVLYEKILDNSFTLSCSIQTYVNSVCRNMLLKKLRDNPKHTEIKGDFDPNISDDLGEENIKDRKFEALKWAFEELSRGGGKCAEMLKLFWYKKNSIKQLTDFFSYENDETTKVQKSKCQKRLKKIATNYILQVT
ncbi:RNA polymerase sigma factor [Kriegella aquimaris]|nr:sigma-70 family RNA polymerase sigma factor [Kriegella aquimaris]